MSLPCTAAPSSTTSTASPAQLLLDDLGRDPLAPDATLPLLNKRVLVTGEARSVQYCMPGALGPHDPSLR